ncbi:hypothetical protein [Luteirhabdus pelagi]|uniref:hypothetical protein n=1 Tax=Luteirhabdus pelagi TaxID=2792783 RepID=UPI0019394971|nr:hypothetical protein [Luteirhabdus pelagi]
MKKELLIILCVTAFASCTKHTLYDLDPLVNQQSDLVTYQDVKNTFQTICVSCHANPPENGAPMSLLTYESVVEAIENRGLLDRISRNEGASGLMPLGGPRLPQATIDLIFEWEVDGLLEE